MDKYPAFIFLSLVPADSSCLQPLLNAIWPLTVQARRCKTQLCHTVPHSISYIVFVGNTKMYYKFKGSSVKTTCVVLKHQCIGFMAIYQVMEHNIYENVLTCF